jgi:hypothetical protein
MYPIQSVTISGSSTTTVSFANIPTNFTHLQLRVFGRGTTSFSAGLSLYINPVGSTASATRRHFISGNGSSVSVNGDTGVGLLSIIADASENSNVFANVICDILDWNNTNKSITFRGIGGFDNNGNGVITLASGLFALSSGTTTGLNIVTDGNWVAGSVLSLYGITTA